jgi:hypothetical protein
VRFTIATALRWKLCIPFVPTPKPQRELVFALLNEVLVDLHVSLNLGRVGLEHGSDVNELDEPCFDLVGGILASPCDLFDNSLISEWPVSSRNWPRLQSSRSSHQSHGKQDDAAQQSEHALDGDAREPKRDQNDPDEGVDDQYQ